MRFLFSLFNVGIKSFAFRSRLPLELSGGFSFVGPFVFPASLPRPSRPWGVDMSGRVPDARLGHCGLSHASWVTCHRHTLRDLDTGTCLPLRGANLFPTSVHLPEVGFSTEGLAPRSSLLFEALSLSVNPPIAAAPNPPGDPVN